ncbi:PepSY1/2 domain-containing protein [Solibacillus sp. FSL H8-0538]|uniref:PepSY1/2 domain-containing protein n=1 Tax=Solibacillus sp. FSL H8-0538 TaxID=2921400 RepID=UPI0030FB300E
MKNLVYLLTIVVVALGIYAFGANRSNNQLEQALHTRYTNELTNASEKLSLLHKTISQSLLFEDEKALNNELDNIWRMSSDLRNTVSNLPLHEEVTTQWMRYLGKIGDSAKVAAASEDASVWRKQMDKVTPNLHSFTEEWTVATAKFYEQDGDYSKWSTNQTMELSESPFKTVSTQLKSYNETDFPLTASESDYEKKRDLKHLMDKQVTKQEAINKFQKFFPGISEAALTVTKSHDDASYPFYHIQFIRGARIGYADITENGGHLLSFLLERPIRKEAQSHEQIVQKAEQFMEQVGYKDVVISESRENHEAWHFVFTRVYGEDEALVYPDSIQVKLAKDNGEVLGVNAMEYIQKESIKDQPVTPVDWDKFFNENVVVEEVKTIYTDNKTLQLRRCYQVIAHVQNELHDTFRVVVDAETHEVIKTEQLP